MTVTSYTNVLNSSEDLVTSYVETRAGFVSLALEKSRQATPYVEEARALRTMASSFSRPEELLTDPNIQAALLTAAGVSDKAANHLQLEDKEEAIKGLLNDFLIPAGEHFVEELVFRFLLTRGDALGGSMRNIGGVLAERKLARTLLSVLRLRKLNYMWLDRHTDQWVEQSDTDVDIEFSLKGLSWMKGEIKRTLLFNVTVPVIGKNIDLVVLNTAGDRLDLSDSASYSAIGELKGGIDPAGADEHWKTASKALTRVREGFAEHGVHPQTFFVGAAVVTGMASEIWTELQNGTLSFAANLNRDNQLTSLCQWLIDH